MKDKFVNEWITRAENEEGGSVFQFVSYYIAFNHIYSAERGASELDCIKKCINKITQQYNHNPFNVVGDNSEILKGVRSEKHSNRKTSKEILAQQNIEELYTSMYYVRCNLFHGSKSMESNRSRGLVKDCCIILRSLFETID